MRTTIIKMGRTRAIQIGLGALIGLSSMGFGAHAEDIEIALITPTSGPYAYDGQLMRSGAELAVEDINRQGGIKSMGGAKLKLVVFDAGDSVEKAKNAAQYMVANAPNVVGASGAFLSSFTLAVTEVTERAGLPVLTLSYSDLITERGFKYVFQTSATSGYQADLSLPTMMDMAEKATGKRPKTLGLIVDNTAASVAFADQIRRQPAKLGVTLVVDEVFTPPLANATPLIQRLRSQRPDFVLLITSVVSDAKLLIEKMNEFGLGRGKLPAVSMGTGILGSSLRDSMNVDQLEGIMSVVANWGKSTDANVVEEFKKKTSEPWMPQNAISTYGDMWIFKEALETAGKADRESVAKALREMDSKGGAAKYFPGGSLKFDDKGRRQGAGFVIVQWQKGLVDTVYPPEYAVAKPIWQTP